MNTQMFSTLKIFKKIKTIAANYHIRVISEGSCDNEDDAENSALITGINYVLKYTQIENSFFKL